MSKAAKRACRRCTSLAVSCLLAFCLVAIVLCLGGCSSGSGELKDGTYTGQSAVYEGAEVDGSGYGVVTLTIEDGAITACKFQTFEPDGTLKDENYGISLSGNENKHKKAQTAVEACDEYAAALV